MNRIYRNHPLLFAILWIVVYVIALSIGDNLSRNLGIEKSVTVVIAGVLTTALILWLKRNDLTREYGLCPSKVPAGRLLCYLPLVLLASVNLWFGVTWNLTPLETGCYIMAMFFVGFLEEVIFRGLLFKAMARDNLKTAVIVSSVTFGIGHIVNLFNGSGAQLLANFCQVCYAVAAGFLFVIIFYKSKSLLPCIATHSLLNALSAFAPPLDDAQQILSASLLCLIPGVYILWLLRQNTPSDEEKEAAHG